MVHLVDAWTFLLSSVSQHSFLTIAGSHMFSQTQEYALRAVVWLAQHPDETPAGSPRIAEETCVPTSYLLKVLQELARQGIVSSKRGVGGGFTLDHSPDDLTVLEVVNAVDPLRRISACPLGLKTHRHQLCPMHHRLDEALGLVEDALANSTIREVMSAPGRPEPLIETVKKRKA